MLRKMRHDRDRLFAVAQQCPVSGRLPTLGTRMMRQFHRCAAGLVACIALSSCANVDQVEFDREVHGLVHDGMPAFEVVPRLQNAGFVCSPDGANPPSFDCVRIRSRLITSCLERVMFVDTIANHGAVTDVKVSAIACAGM
jgi:hypothetical protein